MQTDNRQRLCRESWESQRAAGRHNPATAAKWTSKHGKHRWILCAGDSDSVYFFREPKTPLVYCLSVNHGLGYIGLEVYDEIADLAYAESIFSQNAEEEFPGLLDLIAINQCKTLANYFHELAC